MATIKDVARHAGVSVSTASVALSGKGPVSEATRLRVVRAAKELDYRPNAVARSLVTRRTLAIGLVVSDLSDPYFHEIAKGVEDEVFSAGYTVVLADTDRSIEKERRSIDTLLGRRVDGLILAGSGDEQDGHLAHLEKGDVPVVAVGRYGIDVPSVSVDNKKAARLGADHLIEQGCERVAFVGGPRGYTVSKDRKEGYEAALTSRGLEFREEYTVDSDFTPGGGYEAFVRMTKALARAGLPLPDGVLAGNDQMAIGLLKAAKDLGLRVPGDLALAGIGDIPTAVYVDPPLTTVSLPLKAMGRAAAKSLLTLVKGERLGSRRAVLDVRLMVRASSKKRR